MPDLDFVPRFRYEENTVFPSKYQEEFAEEFAIIRQNFHCCSVFSLTVAADFAKGHPKTGGATGGEFPPAHPRHLTKNLTYTGLMGIRLNMSYQPQFTITPALLARVEQFRGCSLPF